MYTLSVIIPAHNEARNIAALLADVQTQKFSKNVLLESIQVYSDGSTDQTATIVKKISNTDSRIVVHSFATNRGKAARLNQAFRAATTDAVIVLDADVRLPNRNTLSALLAPVQRKKADLTSAPVLPTQVETWVQKMLAASMTAKQGAYTEWRAGNNVFTCHGRVRAFSRNLYSHLKFQHSYNEDSFSYLYCIQQGFNYAFVPTTSVTYVLPRTIRDHLSQSVRFFASQDLHGESIPTELVQAELALPKLLLLKHFALACISNPFSLTLYICITLYTLMLAKLHHQPQHTWTAAATTK